MGNYIYNQMEWDVCVLACSPVNVMLPHNLDVHARLGVHELLGDIPNIQVYLDDIIITSNGTFEEHAAIMETVLERLQKANFRANLKKMLFWRIQN
jgi:hypothetical protein